MPLNGVSEHRIALIDIGAGDITTSFNTTVRGTTQEMHNAYIGKLIYVFSTDSNVIIVTREDHDRKVVARGLYSGRKRILFLRDHGISGFWARREGDRIKVKGSVGFSNLIVDDLDAFLDGAAK